MKKKTIEDVENQRGLDRVEELQHLLEVERGKTRRLVAPKRKIVIDVKGADTIKFALLGDLHCGSLYADTAALQSFYAYAESKGVQDFYVAGDLIDGHRIYKGQEFELRDVGLDSQIERLAETAPRIGITHFIVGNHDQSFKGLVGVSVGRLIETARPDFHFLGEEQAQIEFKTSVGPYRLRLLHPGGGTAYAISYRLQKIIESLEGGSKPNMMALGHFHKAEILPTYRNVYGIQVGCFQRQTPFMVRKGLAANVGGFIVEVGVGKTYHTVNAEFVAYY